MTFRTLLARTFAAAALSTAAIAPLHAADDADTTGAVSAYVDDATITTKVKAALMKDKQLSALDVKVTTEKGVVMLSGTVETPDAGVRAIEIAASVEGVKDVKSALTVKAA
ncbi:phospholipid-binding protein [Chitiniphilus shinanonensis]|uniref:Phospholipid-binding protein n=1 Tax=Chitiniphilus shinanonensis TaxID=553088 RepID=A0ABQ6BW72_9NEIS|nr:BON domain-containing protein [Chitiniphilus shinanonensis]GLS06225.1 phospholipid-binding protein [Chitiniphilus shinanonensis]